MNSNNSNAPANALVLSKELRDSDPKAFFGEVERLAVEQLGQAYEQQMGQFYNNVMNVTRVLLQELTIFRELEIHIANDTLTAEKLQACMLRLSQLRQFIAAKSEQARSPQPN